ncbi:MAG: integrase arm-type DNA-binding domain-containing protein [Rhizobiaceae bacterium]|nr:integrase arm-type DNA-binding domain-containing protein [Rhizobiaceae bacterium]
MAKTEIKNQNSIDNIKPADKRKEYPDVRTGGLYLVVQPTGVKSWAVRYRHPLTRKPQKYTLGKYPFITLAEARALAKASLSDIEKGIDPNEKRKQARAEALDETMLLDYQITEFFKLYVDKKQRQKSAYETKRLFNSEVLPQWGNLRVDKITKRDFVQLLNKKSETAPYVANRMHSALSKFSNWLVEQDILKESFAAGTKKPAKETSRERVLKQHEMMAYWQAANEIGYAFGSIFKLLLLTGARRSEISDLIWSEVDLQGKRLVIDGSRMKGGEEHIIPLSSQAIDVFNEIPMFGKRKSSPVFTTNQVTPVSGFSKVKARMDNRISELLSDDELQPWRIHDVRRTVATGLADLQVHPHIIEKLIAHKTGSIKGVAAIYNRADYEEQKRTAVDTLGRFIQDLVSSDSNLGKVVSIRG